MYYHISVYPYQYVFSICCSSTIFKVAAVKPFFRKPTLDAEEISNYRPISNLPFFLRCSRKWLLGNLSQDSELILLQKQHLWKSLNTFWQHQINDVWQMCVLVLFALSSLVFQVGLFSLEKYCVLYFLSESIFFTEKQFIHLPGKYWFLNKVLPFSYTSTTCVHLGPVSICDGLFNGTHCGLLFFIIINIINFEAKRTTSSRLHLELLFCWCCIDSLCCFHSLTERLPDRLLKPLSARPLCCFQKAERLDKTPTTWQHPSLLLSTNVFGHRSSITDNLTATPSICHLINILQ